MHRTIAITKQMQRNISWLVILLVCSLISYRVFALSVESFESEDGTLSGNAQTMNDGTASGGAFVLFGSASSISLPNPGTWTNVTGNLANTSSDWDMILSAVPQSSKLIAGIGGRGLWTNQSDTENWTQLGTGSGSASITNRPGAIVYDPVNPNTFWEVGIYNGPGVFKTTNGGLTFQQLGTIGHNDFVSIDFSDPSRQTLLAGGHEQSQTLYKSTNGGQSWTNIGSSLPANTCFSSAPVIINSQTYIVNAQASWCGGTVGIYRTTNGGASWTQVSSAETNGLPLITRNGTIYYPAGRWSVTSLLKSSDAGLTWSVVGSGLSAVTPIELPDGRLVSASSSRLMISSNGGTSWTAFGATLPYSPKGVVYSEGRDAFYIWQWDGSGRVLSNAFMRLK